MANLMLSVMGAFAEFKRALIRERQREGIALAKQRGSLSGPHEGPTAGAGGCAAATGLDRRQESRPRARPRHQ